MEYDYLKRQLNCWSQASLPFERAMEKVELNDLEVLGLIHIFSFNLKLALSTLHQFYLEHGEIIFDQKSLIRMAYYQGVICEGQVWMDMLKSQNGINQVFDEQVRMQLFESITDDYFFALKSLKQAISLRIHND